MRRLVLLTLILLRAETLMANSFPPAVEPGFPMTRAEATGFEATSRYEDVIAFIEAIQKIDPSIRVETFATTTEGRALPLVIAGPRGVATPLTAHRHDKPVILILANIHAGEVEGKEAALMFLRDLVHGRLKNLRQEMTFLIAPIYNADGNEKLATGHRPTQNGPPQGVGIRENSRGLDLNRDFMKLESPEARGLVSNVIDRWDPLLTVDLHTTNGSFHGYALTYAPSLSPNAPESLTGFSRGTLLPQLRSQMKKRFRKKTYYYGNFADQLDPSKGWFTFDSRPRFGTNYVGLRNRFSILSEAYSYIDFQSRVEVTYQFLTTIAAAMRKHGTRMLKIAHAADTAARERKIRELGVRFEIAEASRDVEILWEESLPGEGAAGTTDPETGKSIQRQGRIVPVRMTDYGIFRPTEVSQVPWAYLIEPDHLHVANNLLTHGLIVERLSEETTLTVSRMKLMNVTSDATPFQGHRQLTLTGEWVSGEKAIPAGTFVVRLDQPLARLAFHLLEPRSDDGLFNWNFFNQTEPGFRSGDVAPVRKLMEATGLVTTILRGE